MCVFMCASLGLVLPVWRPHWDISMFIQYVSFCLSDELQKKRERSRAEREKEGGRNRKGAQGIGRKVEC